MSKNYDIKGKKVWVAGHRGMVGGALVRRLASEGCEVLTASRKDADLRRQAEVERWMAANKPDAVIIAAATVGGIMANSTRPAEFLYDNIAIEANVIEAAYRNGVKKLVMLGSSCIYPRLAPQPMAEDLLLTGPLEPTNEWYAVAKIAGIKLCQAYRRQYGCDFISAMPCNLYGPGDNYDLQASHVIPAMIRKFHEAKMAGRAEVELWGTGTPLREFLFVDDCADGVVFLLKGYSDEPHINIGAGVEYTIRQLAEAVARTVGFGGALKFDTSKPDGMPRKLMDCSRMSNMGWAPRIGLDEGLALAYRAFLSEYKAG